LKEAYVIARSGKPGPVVIDIPLNIQQNADEKIDVDIEDIRRDYRSKSRLTEDQCKQVFDLLQKAKRPLLYIGGGTNKKTTSATLRKFNNRFNIPVVNTLMAKGVFNGNDDRSLGMLGMFGVPTANFVIQETDLFFALGVRWDDRVADKVGEFGPSAKIIYIDTNEAKVRQINKERKPELSFIGDANIALEELIKYADKHNITIDISDWQDHTLKLKKSWPLAYDKNSEIIQEAEALEILNKHIKETDIITTGVGNHQMFAAQYITRSVPRTFLSSGAFGTMGFSLPVAIGACFGKPDCQVIAIDGDGSLRMNMGELHTIGSNNLPVKVLLLNNYADGMVRILQKNLFDSNYVATSRNKNVNFSDVAKACNFSYSRRVESREELEDSIKEFLSSEGSCMLEVITDKDEAVYPKILPQKGYKEMVMGPYIKEVKE